MRRSKAANTDTQTALIDKTPETAADPVAEPNAELAEFLPDGHPNPAAMDLWRFMREIEEKGLWDHYIGYLYRIEPKRMGDKNPYTDVIKTPINEEYIRQHYGGKKFTIMFNRIVGTRQPSVYKKMVDIEAPPIYQDGEEDRVGFNKDKSNGGQHSNDVAITELASLARDKAGVDRQVTDLFMEANKRADALATKIAGGDAGSSAIIVQMLQNMQQQQMEFMKMMAEARKPDESSGSAMLEMMKFQQTQQMEFLKIMSEMRQQPQQTKSLKDELELLSLLHDAAGKIVGKGSGSGWSDVAMAGLGKLGELAPAFLQASAMRNTAAAALPSPATIVQATDTTAQNPAAAASPQEQLNAAMVMHVNSIIVKKLFDGEDGSYAAELANEFHPLYAVQLAELLRKAGAGDEAILKQLQSDPVLGQAFKHPKVLEFASQFVGYFDNDGKEAQ